MEQQSAQLGPSNAAGDAPPSPEDATRQGRLQMFEHACRRVIARAGELLARSHSPEHVGGQWLTDQDLSLLRELSDAALAALQNVDALTEQSQAQQQIAASEQRFRSLV